MHDIPPVALGGVDPQPRTLVVASADSQFTTAGASLVIIAVLVVLYTGHAMVRYLRDKRSVAGPCPACKRPLP
jgi:hypothetical protein